MENVKDILGNEIKIGDVVSIAYGGRQYLGYVVRLDPSHYIPLTSWGVTIAEYKATGKHARVSYVVRGFTNRAVLVDPGELIGNTLGYYNSIKRIINGNTGN